MADVIDFNQAKLRKLIPGLESELEELSDTICEVFEDCSIDGPPGVAFLISFAMGLAVSYDMKKEEVAEIIKTCHACDKTQ